MEYIMDSFGITLDKWIGCTSSIPAQYKWKIAMDWEATNQESNNGHNHALQQNIINCNMKWYHYSQTRDHEGIADFYSSL